MRSIISFLFALTVIASNASALQVNHIFRVEPSHQISFLGFEPSLRQIDLGLSAIQMQQIKDLTNGTVNFENIYALNSFSEKIPMALQKSYKGTVYPNVPPPMLLENADPELKGQWWIEKLRVPEAWTMASGRGVTIADCDAGYYHDESDLKDNMLMEHAYDLSDTAQPGVVNDGNYAFHGTAVAAIMVGVLNQAGTNGIAYDSKMVPLQNYNYGSNDKLDKEEATAKCILRAIKIPEVQIIVLENQTQNGSSETYLPTREAVRLALKSGITIVSAAGNYTAELLEEKKDDTGSIIIGALTPAGATAGFSNFGDRITVAAFGSGLRTLYGPNGKFGEFSGTSGATPQVAATVALMLEVNPKLTPADVKKILTQTRITNDSNKKVGGLLDSYAAVSAAKSYQASDDDLASAQELRRFLTQILN